jgi:quinoprotein glucose dehydrogenase
MRIYHAVLISAILAFVGFAAVPTGDWPTYGHDPGGQRFSPLASINRRNIGSLKVAWTFRTGDAYQPKHSKATAFETTPLYVDGTLFVSTPLGKVFALDPANGKPRWIYDSHVNKDGGYGDFSHRGVATWVSPSGGRRIYLATIDARLISLDARTGELCKEFGEGGVIDLRKGLRLPPHEFAEYEETSPPAVIGNTVVVGSAVADNGSTDMASGEVRAFDAATGKLKWTWDPMPQNSQATGAANAWSVIVVDPARNLVFVPTGSASPDYYGGERLGNNLFADSVVALQADTGKLVWRFQTVHHDLWDYDVASPPLLFDMQRGGRTIPAIAIGSKTANLFILNRETGVPVFGVEERPVPKSDVPGETTSPTQPFPLKPAPISRQGMTAADAWGADEEDRKWCAEEISKLRTGTIFTPPSLEGTLSLPGHVGGMNWSGMAYDQAHDLLILPTNNIAAEVRLIPREEFDTRIHETRARKLNGDWEFARQRGTPYGMMRRLLLGPKGLPCTAPPWGTLLAIKAGTGEKQWEVPLGQLGPTLPEKWGSISLGGPIVTASGLVFQAGTLDPALRAFDVQTGQQLWKGDLPTSARSMPMTFAGPDGKQYLIICAGSHQPAGKAPLGDYVVAFSL